jgi:hypothetical protein
MIVAPEALVSPLLEVCFDRCGEREHQRRYLSARSIIIVGKDQRPSGFRFKLFSALVGLDRT